MKLNEMKTRAAAFGLAMLMAASPLGSAAHVSAAEAPETLGGQGADKRAAVTEVEAQDITKSAEDDSFMPETCMEGIRYDAEKEEVTLVSIRAEDGGDYEPGKAGVRSEEHTSELQSQR